MVQNFRNKLFILVTVMAVFPLLLLMAIGCTSLRGALLRSSTHNTQALARLQVANFRAYLQEKRDISQTLWGNDHARILQLQRLQSREASTQEKIIIQQQLKQQWQRTLKQGKLVSMGIWDEQGRLLFSVGSSLHQYPVDWHVLKKANIQQIIGIYHFSKAAETILRMVTPVSTSHKTKTHGWLVTDFPFTLHQRFLQEKQAPAFQAMIYVLDQKHNIICGSFDVPNEHHHLGTPRKLPFGNHTKEHKALGRVHSYTNEDGIPVLGVVLPIPGVTWLLLVELPEKQALGVLKTLATQGLIWVTGVLAAWLFAATRLSHTIISQQKQWMAQAIHREKMAATGLLASGVAHEIGNPLASIFACIQRLQRKIQHPETLEILRGLQERCETIMRILDTLRNYVRKKDERMSPINTNREIQKALDIVRFDRRLRHVTIETSLSPDLPIFWAREDALLQVITNLLLNSLDATVDTEHARIEVQTWPTQHGIGISVCDNGIGIDETWKDKVFEPFVTTKENQQGMGLGLSICKSIVESLGGTIQISVHPPRGTCFTLSLPASILQSTHPQSMADTTHPKDIIPQKQKENGKNIKT